MARLQRDEGGVEQALGEAVGQLDDVGHGVATGEQDRLHRERADQRKSQVGTGDRSARVRTYNYPQNRVSDHRLGDNYSLESFMAGKLEPLLRELERLDREERIASL